MPTINRKGFYDNIRTFTRLNKFSSLKQSQVDSIEAIFNEWERAPYEYTDVRWLAYMLATVYHETNGTMEPIEEYGKGKGRPYGKKIKHSGISYSMPNKIYYGRGLVQLTWYENYQLMGRLLNIDLLGNPELALNLSTSIKIMFEGMLKGSSSIGDFTGKCLEMYFNDTIDDPKGARKIINGTDKADLIANYHNEFMRYITFNELHKVEKCEVKRFFDK